MYNARNSFRFIGNIGQDAETKTTPSGTVVTFSVAVNEKWTDDKKVEHKRTDWLMSRCGDRGRSLPVRSRREPRYRSRAR